MKVHKMLRLALYQPDIPQNTGTILRLAACLGLAVDFIEPAGFPLTDKGLKRAGMDYLRQVNFTRHASWEAFLSQATNQRLILLTTQGATPYCDIEFSTEDVLILGRESAGVPPEVHERVDLRLTVPMAPGARSLNVAMTAAMVAGEACRQLGAFGSQPK